MTSERLPLDPIGLAARLQLWVAELLVWLVEVLGDGPLGKPLRRWTRKQVSILELGAAGLLVLSALKVLPQPTEATKRRSSRPFSAPCGFKRVPVRGDDMRRLRRHLFPRERDLLRRLHRLNDMLGAFQPRAQRLSRRIARIMPLTRLVAIAPSATACVALCDVETCFADSG